MLLELRKVIKVNNGKEQETQTCEYDFSSGFLCFICELHGYIFNTSCHL